MIDRMPPQSIETWDAVTGEIEATPDWLDMPPLNKIELQGTLRIGEQIRWQLATTPVTILFGEIQTNLDTAGGRHPMQIAGATDVESTLQAEQTARARRLPLQTHLRGRLWSSRPTFVEVQNIEFFLDAGPVKGINSVELQGRFTLESGGEKWIYDAQQKRRVLQPILWGGLQTSLPTEGGTLRLLFVGNGRVNAILEAARRWRLIPGGPPLRAHVRGALYSAAGEDEDEDFVEARHIDFYGLPIELPSERSARNR